MQQPLFHVMLGGRKVGPYDRRTIVGMRIKQTLSSDHVLIGADGSQLSVADLIGQAARSHDFNPNRSGGFSIVQATYPASLISVSGKGMAVPSFKGEVEARLQNDALRIAGRFRRGFGWKEGRVKLPLGEIVRARAHGSRLELGLGRDGQAMQRITLELFTPDAATELAGRLPSALPWPDNAPGPAGGGSHHLVWVPALGIAAVVLVVIAVLMSRRMY
ncbi:MAG: hypothetical protein EOO54_22850 [Haliea sp.]|nr:MAG: hypothetical protein EOO54_22850 [Haliea sp.]